MDREKKTVDYDRGKKAVCVILSICAAVFLTWSVTVNRSLAAQEKMAQTQVKLSGEVLRFHVPANSDSKEDQEVKCKVRDEVIGYMQKHMPQDLDVEGVKDWAGKNLEELEAAADQVLIKEGVDYRANASVRTCYFPDKSYGDVFFPKGYYEALRIELGEARGHNWWCVLYPNLCFTDATYTSVDEQGKEALRNVLTEDAYEMVTAVSKFKIKSYFFG